MDAIHRSERYNQLCALDNVSLELKALSTPADDDARFELARRIDPHGMSAVCTVTPERASSFATVQGDNKNGSLAFHFYSMCKLSHANAVLQMDALTRIHGTRVPTVASLRKHLATLKEGSFAYRMTLVALGECYDYESLLAVIEGYAFGTHGFSKSDAVAAAMRAHLPVAKENERQVVHHNIRVDSPSTPGLVRSLFPRLQKLASEGDLHAQAYIAKCRLLSQSSQSPNDRLLALHLAVDPAAPAYDRLSSIAASEDIDADAAAYAHWCLGQFHASDERGLYHLDRAVRAVQTKPSNVTQRKVVYRHEAPIVLASPSWRYELLQFLGTMYTLHVIEDAWPSRKTELEGHRVFRHAAALSPDDPWAAICLGDIGKAADLGYAPAVAMLARGDENTLRELAPVNWLANVYLAEHEQTVSSKLQMLITAIALLGRLHAPSYEQCVALKRVIADNSVELNDAFMADRKLTEAFLQVVADAGAPPYFA